MIALGLAIVAGVVFTWLMWRMGQLAAPYLGDGLDMEGYTAAVEQTLGEWVTGLLAASVVCWVSGYGFGIYAVATRSGRAYGVWAIVINTVTPFLGFGALQVAAWSLI